MQQSPRTDQVVSTRLRIGHSLHTHQYECRTDIITRPCRLDTYLLIVGKGLINQNLTTYKNSHQTQTSNCQNQNVDPIYTL